MVELFQSVHRAVLADVAAAGVAPPALAQPALHAVLQGGVDALRGEAQPGQHRQGQLDHDGRAADQGHAVRGAGRQLLEHVGDEAHLAGPVRSLAARVHGADQVHVGPGLPLLELVLVDQVGDGAGAVDDVDVLEPVAQVQAVPDDAAQGRQGDAAGDEQEVLAFPVRDREDVAVGAAEADDVAHLLVRQGRGDPPHFPEGAFDVALAGGAGGDAEGALAFAEGAVEAELAGLEVEGLGRGVVHEFQPEGAHAGRLLGDPGDPHEVGEVDVRVGHGHTWAWDASTRCSWRFMSTGQARVHLPQPTQPSMP